MPDNEIYLLIKYIKNVLWRVAKPLSYIEDARCLKLNLFRTSCKHKKLQIFTTMFHKIAIVFLFRTLLESTKFFPITTFSSCGICGEQRDTSIFNQVFRFSVSIILPFPFTLFNLPSALHNPSKVQDRLMNSPLLPNCALGLRGCISS